MSDPITPVATSSKVRFGVKSLTFWPITADGTASANPTYGTKIEVPGTVQVEVDYESNEVKFYADNNIYYSGRNSAGNTGSIENAFFPDALKAAAYGWRIDANGGLVETDDGTPCNFAMAYQVEGDAEGLRCVHYDVNLGYPKQTHSTTEDGITVDTETIDYTGKKANLKGEMVARYSLVEGNTGYSSWFGTTPVFPAEAE